MKRLPLDYWQNLRLKSLQSKPLKRSPLKIKGVGIRKAKPESLGRLIQRVVTVVHRMVRERDRMSDVFRCISCDKVYPISECNAGHYLPAGNNGVIRFHEWNINLQCQHCNLFLHGNQENYRTGLIGKIGLDNVERLEAMAKVPHKWDRYELESIIRDYTI